MKPCEIYKINFIWLKNVEDDWGCSDGSRRVAV